MNGSASAVAAQAKPNNGNTNVQLIANGTAGSRMTIVTLTAATTTDASGVSQNTLTTLPSSTVYWGPLVSISVSAAQIKPGGGGPYPETCVYAVDTGPSQNWGRISEQQLDRDWTGRHSYGAKAGSSIGVSIDGSNAADGSSGSVNVSNSQGTDIAVNIPTHYHYFWLTEFVGYGYQTGPPESSDFYCTNPGGKVQATTWASGAESGAALQDEPQHHEDGGDYPCVPGSYPTTHYGVNTEVKTSNEHAVDFDSGLTLGIPDVGDVSMQVQSGYSVNTTESFHSGDDYGVHYIRGVHSSPSISQEIFTGPTADPIHH